MASTAGTTREDGAYPGLEMARKVWVLDTSTKGTGATVVPLDSAHMAMISRPELLAEAIVNIT